MLRKCRPVFASLPVNSNNDAVRTLSTPSSVCTATATDAFFALSLSFLTIDAEEELHEKAHIDYDRVAIVSTAGSDTVLRTVELTRPYQIPNPSVAALYEDALVYETGTAITSSGALSAYSGKKTGRSPLDKRIVREPTSENDIWYVLRHAS